MLSAALVRSKGLIASIAKTKGRVFNFCANVVSTADVISCSQLRPPANVNYVLRLRTRIDKVRGLTTHGADYKTRVDRILHSH